MKITDSKLKSIIGFILKNKRDIIFLTDYFDSDDIEKGILSFPEAFFNLGLKDRILQFEKIQPYLQDYYIIFKNDMIMLNLKLHLKQLGPVSVNYMISIKDFKFNSQSRCLYASFKEDATSLGNMVQALALKAALSNGSLISLALKLSDCDFMYVDGHNFMIDLSKFDTATKISESFEAEYINCENGELKLNFRFCL